MRFTDAAGRYEYSATSADVLWLARAVQAEGEPRYIVAATLVNGFMYARSARGYRGSLAEWVRAYAQPVNPRWFPDGDLFREAVRKHPEDAEKLLQIAKRRELELSTRTTFDPHTREAVERALQHAPALANATDYAASWVVREPPWQPLTGPSPGRNRFWARPGAVDWRGYRVTGALRADLWSYALLALSLFLLARVLK